MLANFLEMDPPATENKHTQLEYRHLSCLRQGQEEPPGSGPPEWTPGTADLDLVSLF